MVLTHCVSNSPRSKCGAFPMTRDLRIGTASWTDPGFGAERQFEVRVRSFGFCVQRAGLRFAPGQSSTFPEAQRDRLLRWQAEHLNEMISVADEVTRIQFKYSCDGHRVETNGPPYVGACQPRG
jgi:hypothetical protein